MSRVLPGVVLLISSTAAAQDDPPLSADPCDVAYYDVDLAFRHTSPGGEEVDLAVCRLQPTVSTAVLATLSYASACAPGADVYDITTYTPAERHAFVTELAEAALQAQGSAALTANGGYPAPLGAVVRLLGTERTHVTHASRNTCNCDAFDMTYSGSDAAHRMVGLGFWQHPFCVERGDNDLLGTIWDGGHGAALWTDYPYGDVAIRAQYTYNNDDCAQCLNTPIPLFSADDVPYGAATACHADGVNLSPPDLVVCAQPAETDEDGDGFFESGDNCPLVSNADQVDQDGDALGDACDDDLDGDGVDNATDLCPDVWQAAQSDHDGDGVGDACDDDADGDIVNDTTDNCLGFANPDQANSDADPLGDACDDDDDDDGVADGPDNCRVGHNPDQADADDDGQGDPCDGDDDDDGIGDDSDLCDASPLDLPIDDDGCTGFQRVAHECPADGAWKNHGQYVSCVSRTASDATDAGLITARERGRIVSAAARER